jgi:hypothetical protein
MLFEMKIARLLEILQAEGRWPEVQDWANRWIAYGGWPEPAYRALIVTFASSGDLSKATATYERYTRSLQKELGVKPSEQTQALYKRLKAGWKTDTQTPGSTGATLQKKSAVETAAPTSPVSKVRRSNLPRPLTSFIGREKQIQQVVQLVSGARLVTITGSGGVGKTRLAIQVAEALMPNFRDGIWWVELAGISVTALSEKRRAEARPGRKRATSGADPVPQAVAKALRVPESPSLPLLDGVIDHLSDKQLLLVLDNCEHLIEACAAFVERALGDCPQVTILSTSREALGVPGEKAWHLPSLSLPVIRYSSV